MITLKDQSPSDSLNDFAPDLTPMLDILFILLVFFILTAGAVFQSLKLTLPETVSEELEIIQEPAHILLEIRTTSYALDGDEIQSLDGLKDRIIKAVQSKPEYELVIAGDKSVAIERLLNVLTYLQSQGIEAANILMKKDPDS